MVREHLRGGPGLCARCHARGGGCCRAGEAARQFGLTPAEAAAAARASGLAVEEFTVRDQAPPGLLAAARAVHPALAAVMPGGRRLRLELTPAGDCRFLGPEGCRLPRRARPFFCRLYPVFADARGRLVLMADPGCLAQAGGADARRVLARLGASPARTRRLMDRLAEAALGRRPGRLGPGPRGLV
jgi:Fe-S-cluster containining protein